MECAIEVKARPKLRSHKGVKRLQQGSSCQQVDTSGSQLSCTGPGKNELGRPIGRIHNNLVDDVEKLGAF